MKRTAQATCGARWNRWGFALIAPWVVGFGLFTAGPMLASLSMSFTDHNHVEGRFVGAENYSELLWAPQPQGGRGDPLFYASLWNTVIYMLLAVPLGLTGSLLLAMLLNRTMRGMGLFRTALFLPSILPTVAGSLIWLWMLNPERGLVNQAIRWALDTTPLQWLQAWLGVKWSPPGWLQSVAWSKPSLALMSLWAVGGSRMIVFLAGLQQIDPDYSDAARIDGAGRLRRFWHITLPMITPMIFFNLVLGVIGAFQMFTQVYVMTSPPGGPDNSTLMYGVYLYRQAFEFFRMGRASAMAWILAALLLAFTYWQVRLSRKWVHYEGQDHD